MGAEQFIQEGKGSTAKEAFNAALEEARYEYGHRGYTGSLAEKDSYIEIELPEGYDATDYAYKLMDDSDSRVDNKWGPAGCIKSKEGEYIFFGWASS